MTDYGREKIVEAKKNGQWDASKPPSITQDQIDALSVILKDYGLPTAILWLCLYL